MNESTIKTAKELLEFLSENGSADIGNPVVVNTESTKVEIPDAKLADIVSRAMKYRFLRQMVLKFLEQFPQHAPELTDVWLEVTKSANIEFVNGNFRLKE